MQALKECSKIQYELIWEILEERKRQDAKWGVQDHTPVEWMTILMEEVGEASKAALTEHFHEFDKPNERRDYSFYREEMIQVAAVAMAMLECLHRGEFTQEVFQLTRKCDGKDSSGN